MVSIRDGDLSGWCPFAIEPIRDGDHFGMCRFGMVPIWDCVHSGSCTGSHLNSVDRSVQITGKAHLLHTVADTFLPDPVPRQLSVRFDRHYSSEHNAKIV